MAAHLDTTKDLLVAAARLRYAPEGAWLPPIDHGTKMAGLPICHDACPPTAPDPQPTKGSMCSLPPLIPHPRHSEGWFVRAVGTYTRP